MTTPTLTTFAAPRGGVGLPWAARRETCHADDSRRQRLAVPRRERRADGRDDPPALLDSGGAVGQAAGRRRAAARAPARQQLRRFPRHRRARRRGRRAVPAPPGVARAGAQRGQQPALPVPRLEDQRARRSDRGAEPCGRPVAVLQARASEPLQGRGARRHRLGLARPGRTAAEVPQPAVHRSARRAARRHEPGGADQLGAGGRGIDGLVARRRAA